MNLIVSLYLAAFSFCFIAQANAIEILFRYDLDNDGFFNQPGAKEALEAAAQFYEDLIVDELDAIDPGSSFLWHPTYLEPNTNSSVELIPGARNLVVPANTLVIFAAGPTFHLAPVLLAQVHSIVHQQTSLKISIGSIPC